MLSLGIFRIPPSPGMFLRVDGDSIGILTTAMLLLTLISYPLAAHSLAAFGVAWGSLTWFPTTRKGFADVV